MTSIVAPSAVLNFWFDELSPKQKFTKDPELDRTIVERFGTTHQAAAHAELWTWRQEPEGRLAEILVLDQFSRNMYRDSPQAFAQDPLALALSQQCIELGIDQQLSVDQRSWIYMPWMHSESLSVHNRALELFAQPGLEGSLDYEKKHRAIIERFGRYPHRNQILGRESTEEEQRFLQEPGSSF